MVYGAALRELGAHCSSEVVRRMFPVSPTGVGKCTGSDSIVCCLRLHAYMPSVSVLLKRSEKHLTVCVVGVCGGDGDMVFLQ